MFDGHSGREAARYTCENLWEAIKNSEGFENEDPAKAVGAIKAAFIKTHKDMWTVKSKPYHAL